MNCYFCGSIPAPPGVVELHELEARHAAASRRQRPGDSIALIDGKGTRAKGTIRTIDRSSVQVGIESRTISTPPRPRITIASALPKGDRLKLMLEMLSQLGVHEFVPLVCERSVVKPAVTGIERWSRICLEACKQSHNPFLPDIKPPALPVEFVQTRRQDNVCVLVADPAGNPVEKHLHVASIAICIGPEGGYTGSERSAMIALGAQPVCLARNILRIETAAVVALSRVVSGGSVECRK